MDDRDFVDLLYSQWSRTTGAEDSFWAVEEDLDGLCDGAGTWNILSVNKEQERKFLGNFAFEVDADFIAAVHGCLPDLSRRLHYALDEADRLDVERDDQEVRFADLTCEVAHWHDLWEQEHQTAVDAVEAREQALEREREAKVYADSVAAENAILEAKLEINTNYCEMLVAELREGK